MKILIADDDKMSRQGLTCMIHKEYPGLHRIFEANNIKELVTVSKETHPDLIFLDIKMPLMDRIEGFEETKRHCPNANIVILSGYSDFHYAQKAIQLGAKDYLVKPITLEDINRSLLQVSKKLEKLKWVSYNNFPHQLIQDYNSFQSYGEIPEDYPAEYQGYVLYADSPDFHEQYSMYQQIQTRIQDYFSANSSTPVCNGFLYLDDGALLILLKEDPMRRETLTFLQNLTRKNRSPLSVICFCCNTLRECFKTAENISDHATFRSLCEYGNLIPYHDLEQSVAEDALQKLNRMINLIILGFLEKEESLLYQAINPSFPVSSLEGVFARCEKYNLSLYLKAVTGDLFHTESFSFFIQSVQEKIQDIHGASPESSDYDLSEKIKQYIRENYTHDIEVQNLAQLFGRTPDYLFQVFREKTGIRYTEYLEEIRIANAKRKLKEQPQLSIKEIASLTGFCSSQQFTRVFTKCTNMSPSEYQRCINNENL
ncbi:response regulator [Robinsoniella peoriensis]|uniref:response regulator n=1 Tax=Robinsoniella peoriensis TaxID=180332 RepID=UPI00362E7049